MKSLLGPKSGGEISFKITLCCLPSMSLCLPPSPHSTFFLASLTPSALSTSCQLKRHSASYYRQYFLGHREARPLGDQWGEPKRSGAEKSRQVGGGCGVQVYIEGLALLSAPLGPGSLLVPRKGSVSTYQALGLLYSDRQISVGCYQPEF